MYIAMPIIDRYVHADINLKALRHNVALAQRVAPDSQLIGVVKSQAYGHGLIPVAQALQDQVDMLAVARMPEAATLREAGIQQNILILEGHLDKDELAWAAQQQVQLVIHQAWQLDWLAQTNLTQPVNCWLKFDTGMHRLGFPLDQMPHWVDALVANPLVKLQGLMTHLANADDLQDAKTQQQLERMKAACAEFDLPLSIANSAGILAWPQTHADWVRPGLMLYGATPVMQQTANDYALQAVMTLRAPLIAINQLQAGDAVGYGGTWRAPEPMPVGVLGIGYGDGYPRQISNDAQVLLDGQRASIIGRVSMDMITVDLRGLDVKIGDQAVMWGEGLPIDEVAAWANTIPYTLMCGVTSRVTRYYQHG
jgi:alanine racemase